MVVRLYLRRAIRLVLWPVLPGWPDRGRRIVQGPGVRRLMEQVAEISPRVVLNAGAGEGLFSDVLLAIPGTRCISELDYSYRESRRGSVDSRLQLIAASLTAVPLRSSAVDFVLCTEVLEHVDRDTAALDELARILSPGGLLLITVPMLPAIYDPAHVREGYTADQLTNMLKEREFEVLDVHFCMHAAFKLVMRMWRRYGWLPNALVSGLALLDRLCPMGTPMDLMVLARSRGHKSLNHERVPTEIYTCRRVASA